MDNGNFIGLSLLGGFFVYIVLNGGLTRYIDLLLGRATAATPVTGVANINAQANSVTPAATIATTPGLQSNTLDSTLNQGTGVMPAIEAATTPGLKSNTQLASTFGVLDLGAVTILSHDNINTLSEDQLNRLMAGQIPGFEPSAGIQ